MDYQTVSQFAQTYGLVYLFFLFAAVLTYVLWPGNGKKFDEAARRALEED